MKIAFLLYPTNRVKIDEDSSFWIMLELLRRGHEVYYFESQHLSWQQNLPHAHLVEAKLSIKAGFLPSPLSTESIPLNTMNCIFIRKEPPFDNEYLYCLQL